jgi:hypothetical protein
MSGGSFDYAFGKLEMFADELETKLDTTSENYWDHGFSPDIIAEMRRVVAEARSFARVMHAVEWLWSGDTGEDSFKREMMEIELDRMTNAKVKT